MKIYQISEERLIDLLREEAEFTALLTGGVDNWPWYFDSLIGYLDEVAPSESEDLDQRYDELAFINLLNEFGDNSNED